MAQTEKQISVAKVGGAFQPTNEAQRLALAGIQKEFGGTPSTSVGTPDVGTTPEIGTAGSDFLKAAGERLLETDGIISSEDTGLEEKIGEITAGIETGTAASAKRIESAFDREIGFKEEEFEAQRTSFLERGRGFAVNKAALQQLDQQTEKSLRDLEQRKQELLLAGEANAATQITNLQLKSLEFAQQARQQTFSNTLGLAGFGLSLKAEERQGREDLLDRQKLLDNITRDEQDQVRELFIDNPKGLEELEKLGMDITDVTNIDEAISFISPFLNEKERLNLIQQAGEIQARDRESKFAQKTNELNSIRLQIEGTVAEGEFLTLDEFFLLREQSVTVNPAEFNERFKGRLSEDDRVILELGF